MNLRRSRRALRGCILLGVLAGGSTAAAQDCTFELADVSSSGVPGNGDVLSGVRVSGDGRFVAFPSTSNNLVPADSNGDWDAFVRDLWTQTTELVSVASDGTQGNEGSGPWGLSFDGRYVLFSSSATNLHPLDTDDKRDLFVRDRVLGTTEWISVPYVAGMTSGDTWDAGISSDGRYVAFDSEDSYLVPGDSNGARDVFVRDRLSGTTQLASVSTTGLAANFGGGYVRISGDGRHVLFLSPSTNLWPVVPSSLFFFFQHLYVRDLDTGVTELVDVNPQGWAGNHQILGDSFALSHDGSTVVFGSQSGDLLPGPPLSIGPRGYIRKFPGPVESLSIVGYQASPEVENAEFSGDGRYVSFETGYVEWVPGYPMGSEDTFLHDFVLGVTTPVSADGIDQPTNGSVLDPSMSDDARVIAFISNGNDLVPGLVGNDYHAFVRTCDPTPGIGYCFPAKSSTGCLPRLVGTGLPSASGQSAHALELRQAPNTEVALIFYGTTTGLNLPLGGGHLCVAPPIVRLAAGSTGGSVPPVSDCSGSMDIDFGAWIAAGADSNLVAGAPVYAQAWTRDAAAPSGGVLSEALAFLLLP